MFRGAVLRTPSPFTVQVAGVSARHRALLGVILLVLALSGAALQLGG